MPDRPERIGDRPRTLAAPLSPVDAHVLLNSASVVVLGLATLEARWESLGDAERRVVLARVHRHAAELATGLKEVIQPETL
jgi:hypothetical protein